MGLVKPPWISQKFFESVPFNFCDHFGNKKRLGLICQFCREDAEIKKIYYNSQNYLKELAKSLSYTRNLIIKTSKKKGLKASNTFKKYRDPEYAKYKIYMAVEDYGEIVEEMINLLALLRREGELLLRTYDSLAHSSRYVPAKIRRALFSAKEERLSMFPRNESDAKTSALLAYLAVDRNARMSIRLAQTLDFRVADKFFKFSKISIKLADVIRKTFFPKYKGDFEEFGAEEY